MIEEPHVDFEKKIQIVHPHPGVMVLILLTFPISLPLMIILFRVYPNLSWRFRDNVVITTLYNVGVMTALKLKLTAPDRVNITKAKIGIKTQQSIVKIPENLVKQNATSFRDLSYLNEPNDLEATKPL
jgi:hypothetical protein